jgi:hypothetical protein
LTDAILREQIRLHHGQARDLGGAHPGVELSRRS